MASEIRAVCWDFDKVAHDSLMTTMLAKNISKDPTPRLKSLIEDKNLISEQDVREWKEFNEREIKSVGDLADMLTEFLYDWGRKSNGEILTPLQAKNLAESGVKVKPALSKPDTIIAKQTILKGMSFKEIKEVAEKIEYTPGFLEAVKKFKQEGIFQAIYSDGAGMVVDHQIRKFDLQAGGGVPPYLETPEGGIKLYSNYEKTSDKAKLTGRSGSYNKVKDMFYTVLKEGFMLDEVAIIDDSGSNLEALHKPIKNHGGLAVAFNPKERDKPAFKKAGIPLIDQEKKDLTPFKEIVLNPEKAERFLD